MQGRSYVGFYYVKDGVGWIAVGIGGLGVRCRFHSAFMHAYIIRFRATHI